VAQSSIATVWSRTDDLGHRWVSLHDLAADYWRWQRLSEQAKQEDEMAAWSCVDDLMRTPVPQALDVIQALLDLAETDQELSEQARWRILLSHFGHGEQFRRRG